METTGTFGCADHASSRRSDPEFVIGRRFLHDGANVAVLDTASVDEHRLVQAMLGDSVKPIVSQSQQQGAPRKLGEVAFEAHAH